VLWRAVVRLDPKQGASVKRDAAFEAANRAKAEELTRDDWGRKSLSGHERDRFFLSHEGRQFTDLSLLSGADHKGDGRAVALLDYNRDGWTDLAVANTNKPSLVLFRNELRMPRQVIALRLIGGNKSTRDAIGARVILRTAGRSQVRELHCGEGNAAQNSKTLLFGLGEAMKAETVTIQWPSGTVQEIGHLDGGVLAVVTEGGEVSLAPYHP
jgi:hypothetical protein